MKNKSAVFAVAILAAFVGWCGWLAHNGAKADQEYGWWYRAKTPPPTSPEEQLKMNEAMFDKVIAEINSKPFLIEGKQVVTSRCQRKNPERHDMGSYLDRVAHEVQ